MKIHAIGGIVASLILPGGQEEKPHMDPACREVHGPRAHPARLDASVPIDMQVSAILALCTDRSGAAAHAPGGRRTPRVSTGPDDVHERAGPMVRELGHVTLLGRAAWLRATPKRSDHDQCALRVPSLSKRVTPEAIAAAPSPAGVDGASAEPRPLPGPGGPRPDVADDLAGRIVGGRA